MEEILHQSDMEHIHFTALSCLMCVLLFWLAFRCLVTHNSKVFSSQRIPSGMNKLLIPSFPHLDQQIMMVNCTRTKERVWVTSSGWWRRQHISRLKASTKKHVYTCIDPCSGWCSQSVSISFKWWVDCWIKKTIYHFHVEDESGTPKDWGMIFWSIWKIFHSFMVYTDNWNN